MLFIPEMVRRHRRRADLQAVQRRRRVHPTFVHLPGLKVDAYIKSLVGIDDIVYRRATEELSGLSPTQAVVVVFLLVNRHFSDDSSITVDELTSNTLFQDWYDLVPDYPWDQFAGPAGDTVDHDELLEYDILGYEDSLNNGGVDGDSGSSSDVAGEDESDEPIDRQREMRVRLAEDLDFLESDIELSDSDRYSASVDAYPAVVAMLADGRARFGYESETLIEYGLQTFDVGSVFSRDEVLPSDGPMR